jgi:hypothetical protein
MVAGWSGSKTLEIYRDTILVFPENQCKAHKVVSPVPTPESPRRMILRSGCFCCFTNLSAMFLTENSARGL